MLLHDTSVTFGQELSSNNLFCQEVASEIVEEIEMSDELDVKHVEQTQDRQAQVTEITSSVTESQVSRGCPVKVMHRHGSEIDI